LLGAPSAFLVFKSDLGPWHSKSALVVVVSMFAAFVLYGPVLLVRQVVSSGSRGRLVARLFLSILLVAALVFGGFLASGYYTESLAQLLCLAFSVAATTYLNWRLKR
jgi:hypothetical protein